MAFVASTGWLVLIFDLNALAILSCDKGFENFTYSLIGVSYVDIGNDLRVKILFVIEYYCYFSIVDSWNNDFACLLY